LSKKINHATVKSPIIRRLFTPVGVRHVYLKDKISAADMEVFGPISIPGAVFFLGLNSPGDFSRGANVDAVDRCAVNPY
jgi:hypothetical protein